MSKDNKIIYGFHSITSRIRLDASSIKEIYLDEMRSDGRVMDLMKLIKENGIKHHLSSKDRLDGMATKFKHQGVIALVIDRKEKYQTIEDIIESDLKEPPLILILDGIEDPHNLGACFRVADAMGVHAVICPKDNAVGVNATVRKVACGGAESVPFIAVTNLGRTIRYLKDKGVFIIGTDGEEKNNLFKSNLKGPIAIVLGSEGKGMRRLTKELCDTSISIPMLGQVESLNVSVASGIFLSEIRRQRDLP
jgi:23S rRNA (guanosine2251-2'-O)-methyltransferase|tara:strand:+ start:149 stop:898 length:750 start_codon:yes stop_codon:yes gene_type:complete